ncbi:MAG: MaoC family dehydratase [Lachnospiraceae bacterium]|nr:MaoC family dehydratase [Lachnospiraceae bacterium]
MNHFSYEEIGLGMEEHFMVDVTEETQSLFRQITGDLNPLHSDSEFAENKGFDGRVAFGMLTASYLSTLAGVYLPGENSLIQSVEIKFVKPVYIGDSLRISGTVAEKEDRFHIIRLKVTIQNQRLEKVLRGSMTIKVL